MKKYREHRRRLKDGTVAVYRYGPDGRRIMSMPGSARFQRELTGTTQKSVAEVIREYHRSPRYQRLAPSTKRTYGYYFGLLEQFGDVPIADIRRADIRAIKDAVEANRGVGAANAFLTVAKVIFRFAAAYDYVENNPTQYIESSPIGEFSRWPDAVVDRFMSHCKSEPVRLAALIALHTGQRRADILSMQWSQFYERDGGYWVAFKQQKTGVSLEIPCSRELADELLRAKERASGTRVIARKNGVPLSISGFNSAMQAELRRAGLGNHSSGGYSFHGLRKTAAARLAEAGCSAHEIMSITGHKTLGMVQHYASGADQRVRAISAIKKMK